MNELSKSYQIGGGITVVLQISDQHGDACIVYQDWQERERFAMPGEADAFARELYADLMANEAIGELTVEEV